MKLWLSLIGEIDRNLCQDEFAVISIVCLAEAWLIFSYKSIEYKLNKLPA